MINSVYSLYVEFTYISWSSFSHSAFAKYNPRPVDLALFLPLFPVNPLSKILFKSSFFIPQPVSLIIILKVLSFFSPVIDIESSHCVYLSALLIIWSNINKSHFLSDKIVWLIFFILSLILFAIKYFEYFQFSLVHYLFYPTVFRNRGFHSFQL